MGHCLPDMYTVSPTHWVQERIEYDQGQYVVKDRILGANIVGLATLLLFSFLRRVTLEAKKTEEITTAITRRTEARNTRQYHRLTCHRLRQTE